MRDFKTLLIWQESMGIVKKVYEILERIPEHERYGLRSQVSRAVVSIPSNIAEGCSRNSQKDFY